ncbi:recombinase family protein [Wolbachia endosymbiont of Drosophila ananassae]|nr:recombinase family protein [Wolbachia endosymbiont of Drosophila ananassae]RLT59567.1 recombinase family protein [Wolbachia endosymbiont of Drosophila ananassae]RLT63356.1 recombinase family protein [Wolbachia endosymbiont of Drosophila ananassae]
MTTVALYARVSSKKQAQNNTIESQIAELKCRIAADKHELLDEYEFKDNGISGWILGREGLEALRDKVAEGEIDKIYIHSPDRLSRKSAHQVVLLEEFEKAGVEVIFSNHKIENNPESKLLLGMQGLLSEYECTKTMERSRRGKRHRARKGCISVIGIAPFGYKRMKHVDREKTSFEINEEEAKIVRQIFMWIGQERISIREAIRRLKDMSVRTRTEKKVWRPIIIWKMLRNPAYKGQAAFGKLKRVERISRKKSKQKVKNVYVYRTDEESWIYIPVPKIVDEGLFNKVQKQLDENRKRARMQRREEINLLQGLTICQNCKSTYSGVHHRDGEKTYSYYRCSSIVRITDDEEKCNNKLVRADMLEIAVWEKVKDVLKNPEMIKKEYQRRVLENKNDESSEKKFARRKNQIKEGIEKLMEDYYSQENAGEKGYISEEEFKQTMKKMKERLQGIEEEKKKVVDQKAVEKGISLIINSIKNFYSSVKSNLEQLDWQTKRGIIKALIGQINIGRDQVEVGFQIEEPEQDGGILNLYHCTTHHDKGAGGVCQASFFVSISNKSSLYGYARSLMNRGMTS